MPLIQNKTNRTLLRRMKLRRKSINLYLQFIEIVQIECALIGGYVLEYLSLYQRYREVTLNWPYSRSVALTMKEALPPGRAQPALSSLV